MSHVLRQKYVAALNIRKGKIWLSVVRRWLKGTMPEVRKNSSAEHQAATAGADMLKRARYHSGRLFAIQNEMTKPSKATTTVPAGGPYKRIAIKTKTSEMEIEACDEGS